MIYAWVLFIVIMTCMQSDFSQSIGTSDSICSLYLLPGSLVKFSTDPDVADDECHRLLNEFMPEHIKARKITQHLFIK